MESQGIIMFNKGFACIVRAMVCLYSLRKYYNGNITFYLENPYPKEFEEVCKYFKCDIIVNDEKENIKVLARKTEMFKNSPYDRTLWLDCDTVIVNNIDKMFEELDDCDLYIPHFAGWMSGGGTMSRRINGYKGIIDDKYIEKALDDYPAVNTGVLSFKKSKKWDDFVDEWVRYANLAFEKRMFIADEVALQVLYPSIEEWGLVCKIAPRDYNISVLHDHGLSKDPRIWHFHGKKSVLDVPSCEIFKSAFKEMVDNNIANISNFFQYADKRLSKYIRGEKTETSNLDKETTIVTAVDPHYLPFLEVTYPNWRKYKEVDKYPVIVFVNGIDPEDPSLDFLRLPNIQLIQWDETELDGVTDHRELMLSAFVFGAAKYVNTEYWLKLDADSYACNNKPFITDEMKKYAFYGHKWGYSRPEHIRKLDSWAKTHYKNKLKNAKPMMEEGKIEGNRFYHKSKRTISYIQLHKTKFTKFCVSLFKEKRLPCPSQDTTCFYIQNRFDPELVGVGNFKKNHGFLQGNGRRGIESVKTAVENVEKNNPLLEDGSDNAIDEEVLKPSNENAITKRAWDDDPVIGPLMKKFYSDDEVSHINQNIATIDGLNKPYIYPEGKDNNIEIIERKK